MTEESHSVSIPNGSLLAIANNILELLDYDSELGNEEDLFRDEFFIAIVSNLVTDDKFDISPGRTEKEMIAALDKLIGFLSNIIEIDLAHISAKGIIKDHDRVSTKYLLELIEELIKALKKENEEGESKSGIDNTEEPPLESIDHSESNSVVKKKQNISEGNINSKKNPLFNQDDDEDEDDKDFIPPIKKKKEEKLELTESNHQEDDEDESETKNEPAKAQDMLEQSQSLKDIETSKDHPADKDNDLEAQVERDLESERQANSCIEELLLIKAQQGLDESLIRRTYTENDITRIERELANHEEEEMDYHENYPMGMNYEEGENKQNETPVMNVSHISEVSKSKENSEQQGKINSKKGKTDSIERKKEPAKGKEKPIQQEDIPIYQKQNSQFNSCSLKNSEQEEENKLRDEEELTDSNREFITENIAHSVPDLQPNMRLNCSTSSSKLPKNEEESDSKPKKEVNSGNNKAEHSDISQSSIHSNNQQSNKQKKEQEEEMNENILEELPLNDETLKYEIIKEFRRLYGNKLDRIFLKHNLQNSHDTLEVILRNIKLAKQKMMNIANRIPEPDDLMTKEFMLKYEKELQYIINFYRKEKNKRTIFQDKALKTMTKNVKEMKKIQEISTKKMEVEIERKRKAREVRNQHRQVRICNEIYSKALQLEKEKNLEEQKRQMEQRKRENEEKRKTMIEIEKYYLDKIAILKEILRREKRDREIEHRAKIQFLSKLEREKKFEFKRQIGEVFDRFDEEDKKIEFQDNNQEEIEKILMNYYKN